MPEESNFGTYLSTITCNSLEAQLPVRISQEELKYSTVITKEAYIHAGLFISNELRSRAENIKSKLQKIIMKFRRVVSRHLKIYNFLPILTV